MPCTITTGAGWALVGVHDQSLTLAIERVDGAACAGAVTAAPTTPSVMSTVVRILLSARAPHVHLLC